jgi:hypothetical protein
METSQPKFLNSSLQKIENLNLALQVFSRQNALFGDQVADKIVKGHSETVLNTVWSIMMAYYGTAFGFPKGLMSPIPFPSVLTVVLPQ